MLREVLATGKHPEKRGRSLPMYVLDVVMASYTSYFNDQPNWEGCCPSLATRCVSGD